jgi:ribosomal protein RSM22 (predicted rRNA methylase)
LSELERWLWRSQGGAIPRPKDVAEWVCDLSDLYTLERGVLSRRQSDREHLAAKTLYFLASDAPKVSIAMSECAGRDPRFAAPTSVLDVGCGVGATSVGLLLWCGAAGRTTLSITGVDHEPTVLSAWVENVRKTAEIVGVSVKLTTFTADAEAAPLPAGCDLILCQTALNERLPGNRSGELVYDDATQRMVERWAVAAPTLIIEPALRSTTRPLQRLRDALVERGQVDVVAPCPHRGPCPMLVNERDWCHEARHHRPTEMAAEVQRLTRRRDETALFSMLALARRSDASVIDPHLWRLVSDPLGSKGKTERWVCCGDGRLRQVRILDRERSTANELLIDAERGSLVRLPVLPSGDRIGPDIRVVAAD